MADSNSAADVAPLRYRLLTGRDDRAFCERVSAALGEGYILYGSPAMGIFDGEVTVAQAVILPTADESSAR